MADQIISAVAPNVFERCVGAAGEHLGYIWNYKSNVAKLETQVKKLDEERADKTHAITVAEKNAQKIKDRVKSWEDEAHKISEEATQVLKDHQDYGKKRCLMGLCPNLVSRYQFSKRACKEQTEIEKAMTEAQQMREVSDPAVGQEKTILSTDGCFTFDSRKSLLEDIIKALQDETNNLVGLYGLGGMGKTTLSKQVASEATKDTMFEEVVMASVTQNAVMKEIQGQIASMLGLKLDESTIAERASRIHERLKGKKVLVILDDLWTELDLKQVGIPFGAEHMGCKILLTSRFLPVLVSMGTKKEFSLAALNEEEAWKLFEEKATDVAKNPAFLTIGKKVAKRCAGVPVLIVTVAASLSRRPQLPAWNDALKQLEKMNNKEMHDIVNSAIESISYNHLEETHKRLFVLCGVIGGDASVEEVLQYGMGWDLFDDEVVTIQGARERLHSLILDLKDYCLLLDDHRRSSIKMHDVVRDIAISIGKKDLSMFSIGDNDAELNIWRMDDVLIRCTSIVVRGCSNLSCLPQQLECPKLEMFILNNWIPFLSNFSLTIPDSFFEKTGKLKVLDMSGLGFSVLPSSLSFLKNLQALRLHNCVRLKDISGVGELKKLQTLSIVRSDIEELPSGIGELSELRLLDVRGCFRLKVIPAGLLEGLTRLEELYVSRDFVRWEANEGSSGCIRNNASLVELKHLPNLCTLEIVVQDAKLFPEDLNFEKFERYEITVGEMCDYISCWKWLDELEITRKICLQVCSTSINHVGVKKLLKRTECLYLGELKEIKNVSPELDVNGFPDLKHLCIEKDHEMQYIVNVEDGQHQVSFPSLESLRLNDLLKLQKICNGRLMKESFNSLTIMEVGDCNELKSLFSFSMATELRCLEEIRVYACNALERIVGKKKEDGGVCEKIEFGQLRKLSLKSLPKLKNFISILPASHKSSTSDEELQSCVPFFEKVSFPNLEQIEIVECERLKYLLTPSVTMALVGLQSLKVQNCARIKHIVAKEEGKTNIEMISFPQLNHLTLKNLPHLGTFYAGSKVSNENLDTLFKEKIQFPMLKQLEIDQLESINTLWQNPLLYQVNSFCKLEQVRIQSCASLVKMFSYTMSTTHIDSKKDTQESLAFQNLRVVSFHFCKNLKYVFLASIAHCLNELEVLTIEFCDALETIIGDEESTQQVAATPAFVFPKLARLELRWLTRMESLYPSEHMAKYPALKELQVIECGKVYTMDFLSFPEKQGDNLFEKVTSGLNDLSIRSMDMMKILRLYDHFPPHLFQSLENLTITEFQGQSAVFPSKFLNTIHSHLKTLRVVNCSFQEVFPYEGEVTSHADGNVFLPQLTTIQLEKLPELKSICKQDQYSLFIPNVLDKIERLYVVKCPRLMRVVPPSASFRLLQYLTISNCSGLINVIPLSTARSLRQLRTLIIKECEMIEGIIGGELGDPGEEESALDDDEIIFSKLCCMELNKLSRLTTFCPSHDYTFNFPLLNEVTVIECPNMKTFSAGITITPLLEKVYLEQPLVTLIVSWRVPITCWENDLNTTVKRIYTEMEAKRLATTLPLSNHFEAQAQIHETSKEVVEGRSKDSDNCVKLVKVVNDIREKGKGKELQVSEDTPLSEQVLASSSRSAPPTINPSNEVSHGVTQVQLQSCEQVTVEGGQEANIYDQGTGKESEVSEETVELRNENEIWNQSETKGGKIIASSKLCQNDTEPRKGTQIGEEEEAKRLATTLPPTSSSNHFKAGAQTHVKSARMESGDATNQEKNVADICEKGRGKELRVFEQGTEDYDKYEMTPRYSNPSCSNSTCPEQTVAAYLASSQHVVASSSQLTPQNNNHDEVSPFLATQVEAERLAINHFEAQARAHDNQLDYRAEQTIEDHNAANHKEKVIDTCEKGKEKEPEVSLHMEHIDKSKDTSHPSDPTFSNYAALEQTVAACLASSQHVAASSSQLSPPIINLSDGVRASSLATQVEAQTPSVTVSATSSNNQFEADAQYLDKSPKKSTDELRKEGEIVGNGIEELRREVGTSSDASNSQRKDFEELHMVKDVTPSLSEFLQILQTQPPVGSISAEQVQFMEHAMEWFGPYLQKSRECIERNKEISELKVEIAEMEVRMQALKDKQKALEDENKATTCSVLRFR